VPIRDVIEMLNAMVKERVIEAYAIGGAVAATFYLEPVATVDVDVFVGLEPKPGSAIVDPQPIFAYLAARGHGMEGEYAMIGDWPVQFLAAGNPLVEEALKEAATTVVDGIPTRVFTAEHLAAICLQLARAKDKARLLQFIEAGVLDAHRFQSIVQKHELNSQWQKFASEFLEEGNDL
jgi:hypothetical protein